MFKLTGSMAGGWCPDALRAHACATDRRNGGSGGRPGFFRRSAGLPLKRNPAQPRRGEWPGLRRAALYFRPHRVGTEMP